MLLVGNHQEEPNGVALGKSSELDRASRDGHAARSGKRQLASSRESSASFSSFVPPSYRVPSEAGTVTRSQTPIFEEPGGRTVASGAELLPSTDVLAGQRPSQVLPGRPGSFSSRRRQRPRDISHNTNRRPDPMERGMRSAELRLTSGALGRKDMSTAVGGAEGEADGRPGLDESYLAWLHHHGDSTDR
jgi:hypothetical protein